MKTGLTVSLIAHTALLGIGMFTVSAPRSFDVADIEALPVDIIPVESITQVQEGDREAPADQPAAPKPTERIRPVEDAQKTGDNDIDLKNPPTPEIRQKPVETALAPKSSEQPAPEPEKPADQEPPQKSEPVPAPEPKPEPEPQPEQAAPDPVAETIAAETPETETPKLPESPPLPTLRPKTKPSRTASAQDTESEDQVAALLNREKVAGGGAKRSTRQAALGGDRTTVGSTLTQSEMDALRGQIQRCWNVPVGVSGAQDLKISIKMRLDRSGEIESGPEVIAGGASDLGRIAAESARRAVLRCAPYKLPAGKYDAWSDVIVNFDPSDMF